VVFIARHSARCNQYYLLQEIASCCSGFSNFGAFGLRLMGSRAGLVPTSTTASHCAFFHIGIFGAGLMAFHGGEKNMPRSPPKPHHVVFISHVVLCGCHDCLVLFFFTLGVFGAGLMASPEED